jgi:hypothetical protein
MNLMTSRLASPARIALLLAIAIRCSVQLFSLPPQAEHATAVSFTELTLEGTIRGSQNQSYVKVPFTVPAGTERVTITFAYSGKEQHTTLDLGLLDPARLRCWSGGNKSLLTVGLSDATPSCLPGAIPTGTWNVLIGVPNIRAAVASHYVIHVYLPSTGSVAGQPEILRQPLRSGPAWFRGDLHTHTAHSDGQCPSQCGKMVPCPVFFTVEAAARRGLDFIAITDHNATSQYDAMRELQPYFDKVLLIPGREITTFQGHINFLGSTDFIDFRLDGRTVVDMNQLLHAAEDAGAITSINHPMAPSGEVCLGCGWTPAIPADMRLLTAVEAVNGGSEQHGLSDLSYWNEELNRGCRLIGIGGSDNHQPLQPLDQVGSIGSPTTVVYADNLSTTAILDGIHDGHVFMDLAATRDRMIELSTRAKDRTAHSGDSVDVARGDQLRFDAHVSGATGGRARWIEDGQEIASDSGARIDAADKTIPLLWTSDGRRHWLRVEVAGPDGKLWLIANPIFINWTASNNCR